MSKQHENPEFQVISMEQANAKFYAASGDQQATEYNNYDNGTGSGTTTDIWGNGGGF